ncbi:hypothetical protein SAY86_020287 [Trapa natans]|uniref:Uncharacterized protein n=1 Tax=Trapa natans TaxID=22666 RepID=A0AAN7LIT1_TRANT|nr:hypothetical protein SAY86_020287 [Trapa natans]
MKMGARAGMWGLVKRMHADLQAYRDLHQGHMYSPSTYSLLARITTKFELQPDMKTAHLHEETSSLTEGDACSCRCYAEGENYMAIKEAWGVSLGPKEGPTRP